MIWHWRRFRPNQVRNCLIALLLLIVVVACILSRVRTERIIYFFDCDIPNFVRGQRGGGYIDDTQEFWPFTFTSVDVPGIISNLKRGQSIEISPVNSKYKEITFSPNAMAPCRVNTSTDVIILVKTSPANFDLRRKLRTALRYDERILRASGVATFKHAFLIGSNNLLSSVEWDILQEEMKVQKDFIVGNYMDSYQTLIEKTLSGLRWVEEYCPNYQFLLIMDDDLDLSMHNLIHFLHDPYQYPSQLGERLKKRYHRPLDGQIDLYAGYVLFHWFTPIRYFYNRHYLSKEDYPPNHFPVFVTGLCLILSKKTASSMYYLAEYVPRISVDDAYIGILARKLQVRPFDIGPFIETGYDSYYTLRRNYHTITNNSFPSQKSPIILVTNETLGCD